MSKRSVHQSQFNITRGFVFVPIPTIPNRSGHMPYKELDQSIGLLMGRAATELVFWGRPKTGPYCLSSIYFQVYISLTDYGQDCVWSLIISIHRSNYICNGLNFNIGSKRIRREEKRTKIKKRKNNWKPYRWLIHGIN